MKSMEPIAAGLLRALMVRGVGHTHLMRTGIDNTIKNYRVIVHTERYGKEIALNHFSTLDDCKDHLMGIRLPIAIDNFALQILLEGLLAEIYKLRNSVKKEAP